MLTNNPNKNEMRFSSDDEFYEFCVFPKLIPVKKVLKNGTEIYYTDFNFTDAYKNCVNNGTKFIIEDENSRIYKTGHVSYRTITKCVDNLEPYFNASKPKKKNK